MSGEKAKKKVVVLGAGFAGLTFCKEFKHDDAEITVVDQTNHHLFQPLLYQVATAGLSAVDIAQPVRSILNARPDIRVQMSHVSRIDLPNRRVETSDGELSYDYLVIALGGRTSYFGNDHWEQYAPGLKSLGDAMRIRRRVLTAFEDAETEPDLERRRQLMNIVVVGGGPTGVELAGAFIELARHVLKRDFRTIDPSHAKVTLVESGDSILGHLPADLRRSALKQLTNMGVNVLLNTRVKDIREGEAELNDGSVLKAANIIWAAGVQAAAVTHTMEDHAELDRGGRVKVQPDLSLERFPEVFAVGDNALVLDRHGRPVPGIAPAANQMASHAAEIIHDEIDGYADRGYVPGERPAFAYWDKGTMATIGRSRAVAMVSGLKFSGFPAWLAWLVIHLLFLVGLKNKIAVVLQWTWAYLMYSNGARIIQEKEVTGKPGPHD